MKPYGLKVIQYPDVADIQEMGAKSSCGKLRPGERYCRGRKKKSTRRYWKRQERAQGKRECRNRKEDES